MRPSRTRLINAARRSMIQRAELQRKLGAAGEAFKPKSLYNRGKYRLGAKVDDTAQAVQKQFKDNRLPIAIAGALSFMVVGWHETQLPDWSLGFVYLPAMLGIAATSMFFARLGAKLAHRLSAKVLKRLFALLLLSVGINFLV